MSLRLYLDKRDEKNIYVDFKQPIPQHQKDGIRFLYWQYQNQTPGVILNDPSGYGKCLQVALFLDALRKSLLKQVLIVCDECNIENWLEHFKNWTNFNDIAVDPDIPFVRKQIFITSRKDHNLIANYCNQRISYSVVVVQDTSFSKEVLSSTFNADFKIWVTSVDMKKNLHIFFKIFHWIKPRKEVDTVDFIAKKKDVKDVVAKSILLDAFFEDIVLRRNDPAIPIKEDTEDNAADKVVSKPPKRDSLYSERKNKDPTGAKVKKSKRRIIDDDEDIDVPVKSKKNYTNINNDPTNNENNTNVSTSPNWKDQESSIHKHVVSPQPRLVSSRKNKDPTGIKVKKFKKKIFIDDDDDVTNDRDKNEENIKYTNVNNEVDNDIRNSNDEMDVESFIRNQKPIDFNGFKDLNNSVIDFDNVSQKSADEVPKTEESNSLCNFQNAINEIIDNENSVIQEVSGSQFVTDNDNTKIHTKTEDVTTDDNTEDYDVMDMGMIIVNENILSVQKFDNKEVTEVENVVKESINECHNHISNVSDNSERDIVADTSTSGGKAVELLENSNKNNTVVEEKTDTSENSPIVHKDILSGGKAVELVEDSNKNNTDFEEKPDTSENSPNVHKDISDKIADLEAEMLKKYKGSFLDRIF